MFAQITRPQSFILHVRLSIERDRSRPLTLCRPATLALCRRAALKFHRDTMSWKMPKIGFWEISALIWQEYSPETRRKLFRHEINHLQTTKTCFPPCFEQIYRSIWCEISQISQILKV